MCDELFGDMLQTGRPRDGSVRIRYFEGDGRVEV